MTGIKQILSIIENCQECPHYDMHIGHAYAYCRMNMRDVSFAKGKYSGNDTAMGCTLNNYTMED